MLHFLWHSFPGADISALPHAITFTPGDTLISVRIPITNDDINEHNEVFVLKLEANDQTQVDFFRRKVAFCKIIDDNGESQTFNHFSIPSN